ncbi:MAG: ribonuclease HII [Candidatus Omnitrophota bacterium]
MIVGVDEAGRGPLAGVVTACALHLKKQPSWTPKDSKVLSSRQRQEAFSWISAQADFAVGLAGPEEIDKLNILEATFLAFNRAIKKLLKKVPHLKTANFIIDGNHFRTDLNLNYTCLEKADAKIKEVSCASIAAKVARDYLMDMVDFLYPQWNFSQHKGYPTPEHFSLIKKQPLTPFHRRSFSPCGGADKRGY